MPFDADPLYSFNDLFGRVQRVAKIKCYTVYWLLGITLLRVLKESHFNTGFPQEPVSFNDFFLGLYHPW